MISEVTLDFTNHYYAGVAELVDARDLGSRVHDVRVRVSPPAFTKIKRFKVSYFFLQVARSFY